MNTPDRLSPAAQYALDLIRFFDHPELALEHAAWAYDFVQKRETKAFWCQVIEEIEKRRAPNLSQPK